MIAGPYDFSRGFDNVQKAFIELDLSKGLSLQIFFDESSIEVFANVGERVLSSLYFPEKELDFVSVLSNNGPVELSQVMVYHLTSILH